MRIVDDEGKQQPNDGNAVGHLQVSRRLAHYHHNAVSRLARSA
jgi:hypothetical protein